MRNGIVCAGNFILDRVKLIDVYPAQDTLTNIREESVNNGGSPYSVLLDLSKLGAPFGLEAIGLGGDDADGERIISDCLAHGVATDLLGRTAAAPTSYTDVMTVKATGRRTFFHQRGANALLSAEQFEFTKTKARHLHLGYLLLLDSLDLPDAGFGTVAARVLASAKEHGLTTSFDVVSEDSDRFASLVLPALKHADLVFMNEFELGRTTGLDLVVDGVLNKAVAEEAAIRVLDSGSMEALVLHVPDGACAFTRSHGPIWQGSVRMPADRVVGSVGAGDAFAAGFLLAWHEERGVHEALRLGVCAAASSLTEAGASGGVKTADACLQLGETHGFRS
jgi:sugar/nucleoside kinase (ribokinase family)